MTYAAGIKNVMYSRYADASPYVVYIVDVFRDLRDFLLTQTWQAARKTVVNA